MKKHPTVERLKELLTYDEASGQLVWKVYRNAQRPAGSVAGHIHSSRGKLYCRVRVDNCLIMGHRIIWAMQYGAWPALQIDHIDGNGQNNRLSNLRLTTQAENNRNAAIRKDNKTGVAGVTINRSGRFQPNIKLNGKNTWLGSFATLEEAAKVRAEALARSEYHPNHGRCAIPAERKAA